MSDDSPKTNKSEEQRTAKPDSATARQDRLNAALRENLKKRKRQAQARKSPEKDPETP